MRADRNLLGWGLFFIVFGAVVLGVRQGWIQADVAARAWQIWPLLLVAAGFSLILAGRPGAWVGGLVAAACLGVIAGGLVSSGAGLPFVGCGASDEGQSFGRESGQLPSDTEVSITFRCGDLSVETADGATWAIEGQSGDGRPPEIDVTAAGIRIEAPTSGGFLGFHGRRERWDVTLPADPTIALDVTLNAGEGRLTLPGAHLASSDVTVNAGSLRLDLRAVETIGALDGTVNAGSAVVWLPERPLEGALTVNAGSLSICAPETIGLRLVTGDSPLSSNDFGDEGLVRFGDGWETADFATAAIRVTLDVNANAGSMSLNPRQECAG